MLECARVGCYTRPMNFAENPVIVFDVDGTLLDFVGGFVDWMERQGHQAAGRHQAITQHDRFIEDLYPALDLAEGRRLIGEFNHTPEFLDLPFLPGALEAVATIRDQFPRALCVAVSSMGNAETAIVQRRKNLLPFDLDGFIPVPWGQMKAPTLQGLGADVLFDDHPGQIAAALAVGLPAVLVSQPWNADSAHQPRLSDWRDAPMLLAEMLAQSA